MSNAISQQPPIKFGSKLPQPGIDEKAKETLVKLTTLNTPRGKEPFTRDGIRLIPPKIWSERVNMEKGKTIVSKSSDRPSVLDYKGQNSNIETLFSVKQVGFLPDEGESSVHFTFKNELGETILGGSSKNDIECIFVLDADGKLFIAPENLLNPEEGDKFNEQREDSCKLKGVLHHTSFTNGKSVRVAGKMSMGKEGVLTITPGSGHYKPNIEELSSLVKALHKNGMTPEQIKEKVVIADMEGFLDEEARKGILISLDIQT